MCESMSKRIWAHLRIFQFPSSIELSKFKWSLTLLAITQVALRATGTSWIRPLYFALNCELDPLEKASFFPMLCNYHELKIEDSLYVLQGHSFKYNVLLCKYDIENKNARPLPQIEIP